MLVAALLLLPSILVGLWWIKNYKFVLYGPPSVPFLAKLRLIRSEGGVGKLAKLLILIYRLLWRHYQFS